MVWPSIGQWRTHLHNLPHAGDQACLKNVASPDLIDIIKVFPLLAPELPIASEIDDTPSSLKRLDQ
jgi:hypothetical protein